MVHVQNTMTTPKKLKTIVVSPLVVLKGIPKRKMTMY